MLSPFKDFFHYSRGERRGTVVLLIIMGLLIGWYFVRSFFSETVKTDFSQYKEEIANFHNQGNESISNNDSVQYFLFNPNEIGLDEWMLLGFSEKQAASIEKYKNAGATFKIKSDMQKLFMVDEKKYLELEPYIDLPAVSASYDNNYKDYNSYDYEEKDIKKFIVILRKSQVPIYDGFEGLDSLYYTKREQEYVYCILPFESKEAAMNYQKTSQFALSTIEEVNSMKGFYPIKQKEDKKFEKELVVVDVNTADTLAFSKISGIGLGFARRIIKYRTQLGGFISIEQMKETYYLPPEVIDDHLANFKLEDKTLSKININIVEVSDLKNHPYITWNVANSIVQMRKSHGNFKQVSDIKKSDLINEELFLKIAPYLTIE